MIPKGISWSIFDKFEQFLWCWMHYVEDYNIFLSSKKKWRDVYGLVLIEHQMFDDQPSYLSKFETKNNMQFYILVFHDHTIPILQVHSFNYI